MPEFASPLDLAAFAWFVIVVVCYRLIAGSPRLSARSIVGAAQAHRVRWMHNMAQRENRMLDGLVLTSLSQGNAFFASTCVLAIGGLAALLGSGEKAQSLVQQLPYVAQSSGLLWEVKIMLLIGIFIYAFFKFAWAYRLTHYTGIMIGATPIVDAKNMPACESHAARTAQLIGVAAQHANAGLRSFYYAIAALGWFFHPLLFALATTWVALILARRDFFSRSRRILAGDGL